MSYPIVTFDNQLSIDVVVYDVFNNTGTGTAAPAATSGTPTNYFGTLTTMGTVPAGQPVPITPIHGPLSAYLVYDTQGNPVQWSFTLGDQAETIDITPAALTSITETKAFVAFLASTPTDPSAQTFQGLIQNGKSSAEQINAFFAATTAYSTCTFVTYMMVIAQMASTAASTPAAPTYSLSGLLSHFGVTWPSGFPDVVISAFSCTESNGTVQLGGNVELDNITFDSGVMANVMSVLGSPSSTQFQFVLNFTYDTGYTALQIFLPQINFSVAGDAVQLQTPIISISVNPLFKFFTFEVSASIPFSIFNSPTFNAAVAMTIDNVEAEVGVVVSGNTTSLFTPPIIQGVHFDTIGVGLGLYFEPPGFVLGVQGSFHIGDAANVVTLDDDTFLIVCELEADIPNPLYLSFYVPQLSLSQIITMFTNTSNSIDFPVSASDLSFIWMEDPMEPVTLPDGSLAAMAFGFSANIDIFGLAFYGSIEVNMSNGLSGNITMSPYSLGSWFSLSGDGQGVSIKVDANGNPIPNNYVPPNAAAQLAVQNATTRQLIAPGGPSMTVSTSSSPYFDLDATLKFLDFNDTVVFVIGSGGVTFDLSFGSLISTSMDCTLANDSFTGVFTFGPNFSITLPTIAGVGLGTIALTAEIDATIGLSVSSSAVDFSVSGGFDFEGLTRNFGPVTLDVNISGITDVISAIGSWIESNVEAIFSDLWGAASKWASAIYSGAITAVGQGASYVINAFKTVFSQDITAIGNLLQGSAYALQDVTNALQSIYSATANEVASALDTAYNATQQAVAQVLQTAGYAVNDIAGALSTVYNATEGEVATVLSGIGCTAEQAASAISSVFTSAAPAAISAALQQAGYAVNDISSAFSSLGGDLSSYASSAWSSVSTAANPSNW